MTKVLADVRGVIGFDLVYRNPPKQLQSHNTDVREYAVQIDQAALGTAPKYQAKNKKERLFEYIYCNS